MASYLLPLSVLHAAGPGVLSVVFGPDGNHDDAPLWLGPIRVGNRNRYLCPFPWSATHTDASSVGPDWVAVAISGCIGERWDHDGVALDLRVTSVADRLRRLCERALGGALYEMDEFGGTTLRAGDEILACWAADGTPRSPLGSEPVRFPAIGRDWLGPLVIALAPQIGALAEGRPGDAVAI